MNPPTESSSLPGKTRRPFDIGNFLLGRGVGIFACGAVLFVLLAPLAFIKREPYYHTGGSVLISPKVHQVLSREDRIIHGSFQDFSDTQAQRMMTIEVLANAVSNVPKEEWPSFMEEDLSVIEAAGVLRTRLKTTPVNRSYLLFVGLTGDSPSGLAEMVNAVMQSYILKLEHEQELQSKRRLDYLGGEKAKILVEIEQKKKRQNELAAELNSRTFNELNNPYFESVLALQDQYVLARIGEMTDQSEVQRTDLEATLLNKLDLNILADDAVSKNEAVYLIDNWTYQKLQELRGRIDGLTAENPDRIYVEERMQAMDEYLVSFKEQLHTEFHRILSEKQTLEQEQDRARATAAHEASRELTSELLTALKEATAIYQRSTELIAEGKELDSAIELLMNRYTMVDENIRKVSLDAKAPTHVSIEERALMPTAPASDNLFNYLLLILAGSFGLVGTSGLALELLDSRVRGLRDLQHALGHPAPNPIESLDEKADAAEGELCVYRDPSHPAAASIRKLAVRLDRDLRENQSRSILFTKAGAEDGAETIARNTAAALTQYLEKVLLIRIEGPANHLSQLPSAVRGDALNETVEATLNEIDRSGRVHTLELKADDPLLADRRAFQVMLERASSLSDAVLIEVEPLLDSDFSQYILNHIDIAVVLSSHRVTSYARLRNSIEFVYRSSVPAFTAVLTGAALSPLDELVSWRDRILSVFSQQGPQGVWKTLREDGMQPIVRIARSV